jgi:hypothetical protein
MEPIDIPNSTSPISPVDTWSWSLIVGVRVTQDAISTPSVSIAA